MKQEPDEIKTISKDAGLITTQPKKCRVISKNDATNFYYLSLIKEDDTWSIHGLWPQYAVNKYPQFCREVTFDINKLKPITQDLEEHWYSARGTDEEFWKHEYEKHGSCNFNGFAEFDYFKTTLDLFHRALAKNLPDDFYNEDTRKCLIPVNKELDFFTINMD